MKLFKKYIFLLFMILFSCAVKAPPTGGLEDNKSPYILDVSPVNGSFGLSNKNSIEINFNEMIDQSICNGSSLSISAPVDADNYLWTPNIGINNNTLQNPTFSPLLVLNIFLLALIPLDVL